MQTIRTLSNVSYNTVEFFERKIEELEKRNIIEWCYWVHHEPDLDELKPHIHFTFKPAKRIDTKDFRDYLNEYDPENPLPRTCTKKFNPMNSMTDWLLYAVHDEAYLASKGEFRNIHYKYADLRATDYDALSSDWANIDWRKYRRTAIIQEAIEKRISFGALVRDGVIPVAQIAQFRMAYNELYELHLYGESGRKISHELPDEVIRDLIAEDVEENPFQDSHEKELEKEQMVKDKKKRYAVKKSIEEMSAVEYAEYNKDRDWKK